jgi:hypothetical protein
MDRRGIAFVGGAGLAAVALVVGLVLVLPSGDDEDREVSVPTSRASTTTSSVVTTLPPTSVSTSSSTPPTTRTPPTTSIIPLPPTAPPTTGTTPTAPPTAPPTTGAPTTTSTTRAGNRQAAILQELLVDGLGSSDRGVPDGTRFAVQYVPRQTLTVTWAIDNGVPPLPRSSTAACTAAPTTSSSPATSGPSTSGPTSSGPTTSSPSTSSSSSSSPAAPSSSTTSTTVDPATLTTRERARYEAQRILATVDQRVDAGLLRFRTLRLVGTYPITGAGDVTVVDVTYPRAAVAPDVGRAVVFRSPPADRVACLDPAFA